jgi:hypothetical protein
VLGALTWPQDLQPLAQRLASPAVVSRVLHPYRPAGCPHVVELASQGEDAQAELIEDII